MDNELFELCKEVYRRFPEWGLHIVNGEIASYREDLRFYKNSELQGDELTISNEPVYDIRYIYPVPLYTSDYLLEKLPLYIQDEPRDELSLLKSDINWGAGYFRAMDSDEGIQYLAQIMANGDTPLKALLKLVIALDDAGVKL